MFDRIVGTKSALAALLITSSIANAQDALPESCHIETKVCQICAVDKDGKPVCSSVGIACTPNELVCDKSNRNDTTESVVKADSKRETIVEQSD